MICRNLAHSDLLFFKEVSDHTIQLFEGANIPKDANPVIIEEEDCDGWCHAWFFDMNAIGRRENPSGYHLQFDPSFDPTLIEAVKASMKELNYDLRELGDETWHFNDQDLPISVRNMLSPTCCEVSAVSIFHVNTPVLP